MRFLPQLFEIKPFVTTKAKKCPRCPSINGYFCQSQRYAQILFLEILSYIPAAKIFACLDLGKNFSFQNGH